MMEDSQDEGQTRVSPPEVPKITAPLDGRVCQGVCMYEKSSVIALSIRSCLHPHVGPRLKWLPLL